MGDARKGRRLTLTEAAALVRPRDTVWTGLACGQPVGLLEALGARTDLEDVRVYAGLSIWPYTLFRNPAVRMVSGFFGPIERAARADGVPIEYVAADFHGFERVGLRLKPRVVVAPTTPPDADGWMSFGLHAGATDRVLREALRDPGRLVVCEANPRMPRVRGLAELGDHRVNVAEIDAWVENETELFAIEPPAASPEELAIAGHVSALVEDGATLQFGIGAVPDEIARLLAIGPRGNFNVHTEMVCDGIMHLHRAGKVVNRKPVYDGVTVATFALGSTELYAWLDGNPDVRMLPVSATNEPSIVKRMNRMVSVNAALAVDLTGQVTADRVAGRQYSGVGGHESFVMGASEAPGGKSFVCLKSTATVGGQRVSKIVAELPPGSTVTTPRHHVQYVVTEHGAVDLSLLGDAARARALIDVAHPDFRAALAASVRAGPPPSTR